MLCLVSHSAPVISAFKCEVTILSDQLKSYWHWEKNKSLLYFGITQKDSLGSHINSVCVHSNMSFEKYRFQLAISNTG